MKARIHHMRDFDIYVEPMSIKINEDDNSLMIEWPNNLRSRCENTSMVDTYHKCLDTQLNGSNLGILQIGLFVKSDENFI